MRFYKFSCLAACVVLVTSCSVFKGKDKDKEVVSVEVMYNNAIDDLNKGKYESSVATFEDLERTYPYSEWATKAQIMSAYASFKDEQYDDALITLERFIKLHPGNEDIQYAYYLRALSFYEQVSEVSKDQSYSLFAKSALQEVIARFPMSKYAQDARLKLDLVVDHLAGKEVTVGRFYQQTGNTIAAINRFQKVIKEYDTTSHVPEALHRLVESYLSLGVREEAIKYAAVLGYNFPDSKWYKYSYKLIEGHAYVPEAEEQKSGKWYDFRNWSGLSFGHEKATGEDKSKELIEQVDPTVEGAAEPADAGAAVGVETPAEEVAPAAEEAAPAVEEKEVLTPATEGAVPDPAADEPKKGKGLSGWFKSLKKPFTKD